MTAIAIAHDTAADGTFSSAGATHWNAAHSITGAVQYGVYYAATTTSIDQAAGFTFGGAAAGTGLAIAAGTATTDVQAQSITQTVNASGVVFTSGKMNITKTAAAAGSGFFDYQIAGTSALRFGFPGANSLGSITSPGIKLVSGADNLTLSADNNFTSTVSALNSLILQYGSAGAASNGIGVVANGGPNTDRTQVSANGLTIGRYGISFGRHGTTNNTTAGNAGLAFQPQVADDIVAGLLLSGNAAWDQATVNTDGGSIFIAGGIGRRFFTVVDYTQLTGKTITVNINGTSTTKTEGVNWTAGTSNGATATSIAAAFNAVIGLDANYTVAVGANAYFQPSAASWTYQLDLTTNAAAGGGTVTLGNNGTVRLDIPRAVANLPAAAAGLQGCRATVTDSNAASYTAGIGAIVAAGGTTVVPVFCDGTNWRIG